MQIPEFDYFFTGFMLCLTICSLVFLTSKKKVGKEYIILGLILTLCLLFGSFILISYFNTWIHTGIQSDKTSEMGAIGDFIGGTLNPLLSFLSITLILITLHINSKELKLSTAEFSASRKSHQLQQIENSIYNLIKMLKDDCDRLEEKIEEKAIGFHENYLGDIFFYKDITNSNKIKRINYLLFKTLSLINKYEQNSIGNQDGIDFNIYKDILKGSISNKIMNTILIYNYTDKDRRHDPCFKEQVVNSKLFSLSISDPILVNKMDPLNPDIFIDRIINKKSGFLSPEGTSIETDNSILGDMIEVRNGLLLLKDLIYYLIYDIKESIEDDDISYLNNFHHNIIKSIDIIDKVVSKIRGTDTVVT